MCGCNGHIVLRTVDGMEKVVETGRCEDLREWRVPYLKRSTMAVMYTAADIDTFPTESLTAYREYRRNRYHEEVNGMPVFDEVVEAPRKPERRIADLDSLGGITEAEQQDLDEVLRLANGAEVDRGK